MKHLLDWAVGFCDSAKERPETYFRATVPGAVQLDYAREYHLPDYRREKNFEDYKWMEDKFWVYTAEFDASSIDENKNLFLLAKGIDYQYDIFANGKHLYSHRGMYTPVCEALTDFKGKKIRLEIVIYPAPKSTVPNWGGDIVHKDTRDEANQCCKPAVSYGWDFHPRLVPLGIWDDICILETLRETIVNPEVRYILNPDRSSAQVTFTALGTPDGRWTFCSPNGEILFEGVGENLEVTVEQPELWWCNGYGEPRLYSWTFRAEEVEKAGKTGFKTVELVKAPGSWKELGCHPLTRNTPPITLRLNGVEIFSKGTNWVTPEIFYGTIDYDRYLNQLKLVKAANLNYVRCWGGAVVNKECFFDICDELGILVWQEFPLACNNYVGTPDYISQLRTEGPAIINRVKNHACLMLWCGGNELFNGWSGMTDQSEAIRLMNHMTYVHTPEIPFLSTAPVMGMAHGGYTFEYGGKEVFAAIAESNFTAYTEFGMGGYANLDTLTMITDKEQLFKDKDVMDAHGTHLKEEMFEKYIGKVEDVEKKVQCGQLMQSAAQQFVFEEARRQKPYCSMASNWCLNEPWPNTCNNSLVGYPNSIKPAYYAVSNACRSVLASARIRKFVYKAGEMLDFDLFLLNDSLEPVADGKVNVYVQVGENNKECLLQWEYTNVSINTNVAGPTVRYPLPYVEDADFIKIILECGEYSSNYVMLYRLPKQAESAPRKMNALLEEN